MILTQDEADTLLKFLRDHRDEVGEGTPLDKIRERLLGCAVYGDNEECEGCSNFRVEGDDEWCILVPGERCIRGYLTKPGRII